MKNSKFFATFALAALLFNTAFSGTTSNQDFASISATTNSIIVQMNSVAQEAIEVKIVNEEGIIVLTETVKNVKSFNKKYNMSQLLNGNYSMIVTRYAYRTIQPFSIKNGALTMFGADKKEQFVAVFDFQNSSLKINFLLKDYGNIKVTLYDNEGRNLLFNKTYKDALSFHQIYNLSKLPTGIYFVEMTTPQETFYYTIVK